MQLTSFAAFGPAWVIPLRSLCIFVVLIMAGCGGAGDLMTRASGGGTEAQTELDRFKAKDMDYGKIVDQRREVRKYIAMHGWGAVDREGDPLSRYLNSVLKRIIAVSPLPDVPSRVVVVDLQVSPVAIATEDGTIYVPIKLLADMDANPNFGSEDALAFLLAHELSHILYYHFGLDTIGDAVEATMVGTEIVYSIIKELGDATGKTDKADEIMEKVETFYERAQIVQFVEESALTPAFTREQENEADLLAFDLMIKAGYNPDAAYDFMDFLQAYEEETERLRKEREAEAAAAQDTHQDPLGQLTGILVEGLTKALEGAKRQHATVGQRRKALNEYHDRWADDVAEAEDLVLRRLGWKDGTRAEAFDEMDAETVQRLFENYAAAKRAEIAAASGNHDDAEVLIRQSLSSPTKFNAFPRIVAAFYYEDRGERAEAIKHLGLALQGPGPSFQVYEELLQLLNDDEERLAVLLEAEQRFGSFVRLMRLRATILEKLGREEEASQVRSSCYFENLLSKERNECNEPLELP